MKTSLTALLLAALMSCGAAAEPCAWAIRNTPGDYEGQLRNQRLVVDLLRNGCEVLWVAQEVPLQGVPPLRQGDYVVAPKYDAALIRVFIAANPRADAVPHAGPQEARFQALKLNYPRIFVRHMDFSNWYLSLLHRAGLIMCTSDEFTVNREFDRADFNLHIIPGGSWFAKDDYMADLRAWVKGGGNFIGSCCGAAIAINPSRVGYEYMGANGAGIVDAEQVGLRGSVVDHLVNVRPDHPVMWNVPERFTTQHIKGPLMRAGKESQVLARLDAGEEAEFITEKTTGFKGPYERWIVRQGDPPVDMVLAAQRLGEGKTVVFGGHPEVAEDVVARHVSPAAQRMVCNAIFWATADAARECTLEPAATASVPPAMQPVAAKPMDFQNLPELQGRVRAAAGRFRALLDKWAMMPRAPGGEYQVDPQDQDTFYTKLALDEMDAFSSLAAPAFADAAGALARRWWKIALEFDRQVIVLETALAGIEQSAAKPANLRAFMDREHRVRLIEMLQRANAVLRDCAFVSAYVEAPRGPGGQAAGRPSIIRTEAPARSPGRSSPR